MTASVSKKLTKKQKLIQERCNKEVYDVSEAVSLLDGLKSTKMNESIDVAVRLGVDPRKSDQAVRGSVVLPNGTGKSVRVAVFAQGAAADAARAAGAELVGFEDLVDTIKQQHKDGSLEFDVLVASPDAMRFVGQLGRILGPRGLMPNPKVGTVTPDVAKAVENAKSGQVSFRADKGGIVHASIGRIDFSADAIAENLSAFVAEVKRLKPSTAKGTYIKKVTMSSTMGPGLTLDTSAVAG